jgi:hypothetical protein
LKKNILILIQGPLISYGQGPNNSTSGFIAESTIIENSILFNKYNIEHVVVTWKTINFHELSIINHLEELGIKILSLTPPQENDYDHRFKHHYALSTAFSILNSDNYEYIGKIRTDQLVLEQFIENLILFNSEKILISELMKSNDFYLGDFTYFGKTKNLKYFIDSQIKKNFFHTIIANDIGMKFYVAKNNYNSKILLLNYFFRPKLSNKKWTKFVNDNIETIDSNIWDEIRWRGKKMKDIVDKKYFLFTNEYITTKPNHYFFNIITYYNGLYIYSKKVMKFLLKKYFNK